jgi:hypothetical protein
VRYFIDETIGDNDSIPELASAGVKECQIETQDSSWGIMSR